jgi:hypothetical protein
MTPIDTLLDTLDQFLDAIDMTALDNGDHATLPIVKQAQRVSGELRTAIAASPTKPALS